MERCLCVRSVFRKTGGSCESAGVVQECVCTKRRGSGKSALRKEEINGQWYIFYPVKSFDE